jgi:hypothetical protein
MPKRQNLPRTKLSDSLEGITLPPGGHFAVEYVFTGEMQVTCPLCDKPAVIKEATLGLELSCGCCWHPPRHDRRRDKAAWVSYGKEAA